MDGRSAALHWHTPHLHLLDPRSLACATVAFCRRDVAEEAQARTHRTAFDAAGRAVSQWDSRLWADHAAPNLSVMYSLSGRVLLSDSVDAGWRLELPGEGGQAAEGWDGRGTLWRTYYDAWLRPTAVFENRRCVARLSYGGPDSAEHNQCGQLIRHDDPAGTGLNAEFSLTGNVTRQIRHFLRDLDVPDWPEPVADRDALLEPGEGATTHWTLDPFGEVVDQTDAQGHLQTSVYTVAGLLKEQRLQLAGRAPQILVGDIRYDAHNRVEAQSAGNGVVTTARYDARDGRLLELKAVRSSGELLQDFSYDYDPVGNVTRIEDRAQPIRYFANQRIEPVSTYRYDTLYQLIEATGRELATVNHGPVFADFQSPPDPAQLANYTQTYQYDAGGNLQQLTHVGSQNHTRTFVTARSSNRSLPVINNQPPDEDAIAAAFDANGNLLQLQPGQVLSWNLRNQLQDVRPVVRESGADDSERYLYDGRGQRLRKVRTTQAKAVTHVAEVRYLPGLEIRTDTASGETLQVITTQAGRNGVRVLHWQAAKPPDVSNDQVRYSLNDHLGSSTLELDAQAQIISQESYYPYGGTSWWAGRNAVEASYKTVRYSGKERDGTGLYYYGFRYYAPWLQRWINPDPAGAVDGLNLYRFVRNSPLRYFDSEGAHPQDVVVATGFSNFTQPQQAKMREALDMSVLLLKITAAELGRERPGYAVSEAFSATFGEDLSLELKKFTVAGVRAELIDQANFLSSLLEPEMAETLHLYDFADARQAETGVTTDYDRTYVGMRISRDFLEKSNVLLTAFTFIHEASHAASGTVDVYYHDPLPLETIVTPEQVKVWSKEIRKSLQDLSASAPDEASFDAAGYKHAMQSLRAGLDTAESRTEAFLDPNVRTSLMRLNADTYAAFVMSSEVPAALVALKAQRTKQLNRGGPEPKRRKIA
ncbi:RHS repeat protein [Pseudomonas sp. v388]|uniref:RHS repeat domain-containing protein n=1 Tax=Pseudomonas sp. v388 TaxID=2479849 RepID=UPI000F7793DD|nr:RHS repeat-associated core domain-containing protein [Pseudomonas sp. v388]RRV08380.1 RHS repeat protein [Pseudomonas sp. v388]